MSLQASLQAMLDAQRAALARQPATLARRREALRALRTAVWEHRDALVAAVSRDFGGRAPAETLALEIFVLLDQLRFAERHVARWMRRRRVPGSWFLLPARAFIEVQPLGVVGIIGAWNYPVLLTLGPLIDALAAGNHALVKPSELAPHTAAAIAALLAEAFPPEHVLAVPGGREVAEAFCRLPLDHLLFTGSTRVGRAVMAAAAEHLVPVTLELGGKSPAIVHDSYPIARAAERILGAKLLNAGQTCVAPDYVLLPVGQVGAFEAAAREAVAARYPHFVGNADYTRIGSEVHLERLHGLVADARARGATVVELRGADEDPPPGDRLVFPTLILGATPEMAVMQEEIFGPLLPVVAYDALDEALVFVNARPRPLALYYFDDDRRRQDRVLAETRSGGVTFNDCLLHLAQHHLPFGGVGPSGMGRYHGRHGFETFSKQRGVMVQGRWSAASLLAPPYAGRAGRLLDLMLRWVGR
ncbi:MAG: aldehyde dehydrogenase family protein [Candidatus Sericytochromatia bacterium]|nr:aldehyde dehydrogenase family protein [Candidatus Sericytochromatia bacterium]